MTPCDPRVRRWVDPSGRGGRSRPSPAPGFTAPVSAPSAASLHTGRAALACFALALIVAAMWWADVSLRAMVYTLIAVSIGLGFAALLFDYLEDRR